MAKLKGPLFSLGASQQLGKALVFFPWKGLNLVREYVIPANPRTAPQTTQRGYLTDAVAMIHAFMALPAVPLDATDVSAYALWGSTYPTPRTWFNQAVKNYVDQKVAGLDGTIFGNGTVAPAPGQVLFFLSSYGDVPGVDACNIHYGTSKTALINTQATTMALLVEGVIVAGLTDGVKYYFQVRPTTPAEQVGNRSGIYYCTPG